MSPLLFPFVSYAFVTTFTPGPNNVAASTIGMRVGYGKTFPFLLGIASGFFILMFAAGLLTDFFTRTYGVIAPWLRWIGVIYMLWLTISLFLPHRKGSDGTSKDNTFLSGFLLQIVNPKVILYGITIYTSFSSLIATSLFVTTLSALSLSALGFVSVSLWALTGATLGRFLANDRARLAFNLVMAAFLLWCAWSIAVH